MPPEPVPRRAEWAATAVAAGRRGRRPAGRRHLRRGVPETASRRVIVGTASESGPRRGDRGGDGRPGDPACRHGLVLRLRRGPRRSGAGRPAGDRRGERTPGGRGGLHLRGAHVRSPLGHAVLGGPAALSGRRLPRRTVPPLRRGEPTAARHPGRVHTAGRRHLARRGVPRRERGRPPVRIRDEHGPRDPAPGPRGDGPALLGRGRTDQADGQAGVQGGQAEGVALGHRARARGGRGAAPRRSSPSSILSRCGRCGASARSPRSGSSLWG